MMADRDGCKPALDDGIGKSPGLTCYGDSKEAHRRLKKRDRDVLGIADFTAADIVAVRRAEPPQAAEAFNHELDQ